MCGPSPNLLSVLPKCFLITAVRIMKERRIDSTPYFEKVFLWDENIRFFFSYYFFKTHLNGRNYFILESKEAASIQRILNNKIHELGLSFNSAYFQYLAPDEADWWGLGNRHIVLITEGEGNGLNNFEAIDATIKYAPQQIAFATKIICQLIDLNSYYQALLFSQIDRVVFEYGMLGNPDTVLGIALANATKLDNAFLVSPLITNFLSNPRGVKVYEAYSRHLFQTRPCSFYFFGPTVSTYNILPPQMKQVRQFSTPQEPPVDSSLRPLQKLTSSEEYDKRAAPIGNNKPAFFKSPHVIKEGPVCVKHTIDLTPLHQQATLSSQTAPLPKKQATSPLPHPTSTLYVRSVSTSTLLSQLPNSSPVNDDFALDAEELPSLFEDIDDFLKEYTGPK